MAKTILLVDDNARERELITELLDRRGVKCIALDTGEEALGLLLDRKNQAATEVSAVFLDLAMPGVTGMEVLAGVRDAAVKHRVPVVVMTSSKNAADVALSYSLGANAYLPKPNNAAAFAALLDAAVRFWTEINSLPSTPESGLPHPG